MEMMCDITIWFLIYNDWHVCAIICPITARYSIIRNVKHLIM